MLDAHFPLPKHQALFNCWGSLCELCGAKTEQAWWELLSFEPGSAGLERRIQLEKQRIKGCRSSWLYFGVHTGMPECVHVCVCVSVGTISKPDKFHLHGQFNGKLAWKCSISYFMNLIGFSWFYKVLQPDTHGWRLHSRRPKTLHLCFSTLARIHWIWSGMTMHLWNVHSLFSCLIQIKEGHGGGWGRGKKESYENSIWKH